MNYKIRYILSSNFLLIKTSLINHQGNKVFMNITYVQSSRILPPLDIFHQSHLNNNKSCTTDIIDSCSCLWCPSKMGIVVTAFGLPILLTSGNTLYPIFFLGGSLSLSLYYDTNRIGKPKAGTPIPIFLGH